MSLILNELDLSDEPRRTERDSKSQKSLRGGRRPTKQSQNPQIASVALQPRNDSSGLPRSWPRTLRKRIRPRDLRFLFSGLSSLLHGGIPLLASLELLSKEENPKLRKILQSLASEIREGRSLSEAFTLYPHVFSSFHISMVRAGEISGTLEQILRNLALQIEKEEEIKGKLKEALAYPLFILTMGILTILILSFFVIPKLALIYQDFGGELPLITRIVIQGSQWIKPVFLFFILLPASCYLLLRRHPQSFYSVVTNLPLLGSLLAQSLLIRFSSLLSLLLQSGIPVLEALEVTGETLRFSLLEKDLRRIKAGVREGDSLAQSLRKASLFNPSSLALISSGEESGRLPESLAEISKAYSEDLSSKTRLLLKLLEPSLILLIGLLTGFIVIAMLLPITTLSGIVK